MLRERFNIDVHDQSPRAIDEVAWPGPGSASDRLVTLCDKARERLPSRGGGQRTHWSIPDPADAPGPSRYASFVATALDIDARVRHLVPTLTNRR